MDSSMAVMGAVMYKRRSSTHHRSAGLFDGGDGRDDVQAIVNSVPVGGLFDGGDGRGDVQAAIINSVPVGGLFDGGDGRGDVQAAIQ
ncbi:MAG: hypothetical protein IPG92_12535 [Flavobacteriales bacterium]|nr:hypothetical protein [Flavobacteriales bacterium]